jgi:hypothetical protein
MLTAGHYENMMQGDLLPNREYSNSIVSDSDASLFIVDEDEDDLTFD